MDDDVLEVVSLCLWKVGIVTTFVFDTSLELDTVFVSIIYLIALKILLRGIIGRNVQI